MYGRMGLHAIARDDVGGLWHGKDCPEVVVWITLVLTRASFSLVQGGCQRGGVVALQVILEGLGKRFFDSDHPRHCWISKLLSGEGTRTVQY
jgi:hypothetical protein